LWRQWWTRVKYLCSVLFTKLLHFRCRDAAKHRRRYSASRCASDQIEVILKTTVNASFQFSQQSDRKSTAQSANGGH
jgi:hypothetical protein